MHAASDILDEETRGRYRELEALVIHSPDLILRIDDSYNVTYANPALFRTFTISPDELIGLPIADVAKGLGLSGGVLEYWMEICEHVLDTRDERTIELFSEKDGEVRYLQARIVPVLTEDARQGVLCVARDLTDQRCAELKVREQEESIRKIQRLEEFGKLAGGIAHDFNNVLTAILGYVDLGLTVSEPDDEFAEYFTEIRSAASRASGIARQLLIFSRHSQTHLEMVDINEIINSLLKMLERLIGENVSIETDLSAELPVVQADTGKLEQILMNLVVNARDAMPEGGGIRIRTTRESVANTGALSGPYARPGEYVLIRVEDTGTGMDRETLSRIFEPFFTTKREGKGTGLGLSVVFGIVRDHNGWIDVQSEPGEGTRFDVYLPAGNDEPIGELESLD